MWFVVPNAWLGKREEWDYWALVRLNRLLNNAAFKQRLRDNAGSAVRQREVEAFPEAYREAEFDHWDPKTQALIEQQEQEAWRRRSAEQERALALLAEYMSSPAVDEVAA